MSKELRKTIITAFRKFSIDPHLSPLKKQKDREIAGRFIDRVHSTTFDTSSLPYYSKNGLAKHANKAECVFAMMCDIILTYWRILGDPPDVTVKGEAVARLTDVLTNKLILLSTVCKEYDQLKILGDEKGYCLLSSLRKDLYGKKEKHPKGKEVSPEETTKGAEGTVDGEEAQVGCEDCSGSGLETDKATGVQQDDPCKTCAGEGTAVGEDE